MGELYPLHKKQTKNPAETTGNRYKIEILMSRTQKLKGVSAASLRVKTLNDNPYVRIGGALMAPFFLVSGVLEI